MKNLTLPLLLTLAACGAETGNGLGPTVALRASQSGSGLHVAQDPPVLEGTDAQGTPLTLAHARANVRSIELYSPDGQLCVDADYADSGFTVHCDSAKMRIEGPIVVDLMTGASVPSLERVVLPAAVYQRVDVRLEHAKKGEVLQDGDPLLDLTLIADGELSYRGTPTPYDLGLKFSEDARFESATGVEVGSTEAARVLLLLDVSQWFTAIPLTGCLDDGDLSIEGGRIAIEDKGGRCNDIEKALKDAIKGSSRLGKGPK